MGINKDINSLKPITKELVLLAIDLYTQKYKKALCVIEAFRNEDIQNAYYSRTREPFEAVKALYEKAGLYKIDEEEAKTWATNAKFGDSAHNYAVAIDICPSKADGSPNWKASEKEWNEMIDIFESVFVEKDGYIYQLESGRHWKNEDSPHLQVYRTKNGVKENWKMILGK